MNSNALIGECFAEWLASRSCSEETCERDYGSRIKLFLRWIDEQGLRYWRDLRLLHLQSYANHLVQTGKATRTIELQCRVVKMASKWAAQTWPEYFRDFAAGFRTPRQNRMVRYSERGGRAVLRLKDVGEFALWLREQGSGAHILPGILLQGLCSLRVREVLRLTWDNVDFEAGTVTVEGYVKNLQSVRRIPVPRIVLAALAETPREGPRLLAALKDQCSYGRAFRRNLRHWRPGFHIEPKGLRRTLVSEFFEYGWYGDVLQMYRGHQPSVSAIDWNHYIVYQPAKILEMFREQVVSRVDVLMEETLQKWLSVKGAEQVIPLPLLTASDR